MKSEPELASVKILYTPTAVIELGAGLALLGFPSAMATLLVGSPLEGSAALTVARVAGTALLALAVACWLARGDTRSPAARGLVAAMVLYNLGVALILGAVGIRSQPVGVALWPAVVLHAVMTIWCIVSLLSVKPGEETS
jgi:spore maturation protein SpmB